MYIYDILRIVITWFEEEETDYAIYDSMERGEC
jgi:hypothetical protein